MSTMKDSGIVWIGLIPKEWNSIPIRAGFEEVTDKNYAGSIKNALKFTYGEIVPKTNFEAEGDDYVTNTIMNYTVVEPGTIILNGLNLNFDFVSQRIGLVKTKGVITSAYMAFKPSNERISSEFATYLFKAYDGCKAFHNMGGGVRKILNFNEFKRYYVCFPSTLEQKAIVNYLDSKCAEIDALTTDIQSEINTLEAYKRSVITEAVTKGLNPNVPMKDSGIEWVGDIPASWNIQKGKYCLNYIQKPTKPDDDVVTCFRDGEVTLRKNRREDGYTISLQEIGYQGIDVGDLIVHGMDGFAGAIGISDSRGKASPVLNVLDTDNNKKFIMYYLRSLAFNGVFIALATGIRVRTCDTNWGKLRELLYVLPPKEEQDEIVKYIDERLSATDEIISKKQEQLAVLADYKKSVIYEYVTGKKEVPAT